MHPVEGQCVRDGVGKQDTIEDSPSAPASQPKTFRALPPPSAPRRPMAFQAAPRVDWDDVDSQNDDVMSLRSRTAETKAAGPIVGRRITQIATLLSNPIGYSFGEATRADYDSTVGACA